MQRLQMAKARQQLTKLPERLKKKNATVVVTRKGEPVMAILSWNLYQGIVETLEILSDAETMKALRRGLKDIEEGRVLTTEELERDLRL